MALTPAIGSAYSQTGGWWQRGPARVYDRMADLVVSRSPVPVAGAAVADIGAGTGAGGRAARHAGAAAVVALDVAVGMLTADPTRPPAAAADARALPLRTASVDVALAAFSLNHLTDPAEGLREAARVVRPGGAVLAGAYAREDDHPVKEAVEDVLRRHGWEPPAWVVRLRRHALPLLATVAGARSVADCAGLGGASIERHEVALRELGPGDLVAWRLGMAQHAPFVASLAPAERAALADEAVALLGPAPPVLVRAVVVVTAVV